MAEKIEKPKKLIAGEIYMVNYVGWKKVKLIRVDGSKSVVQEVVGLGEPFMVDSDKVKVNLL